MDQQGPRKQEVKLSQAATAVKSIQCVGRGFVYDQPSHHSYIWYIICPIKKTHISDTRVTGMLSTHLKSISYAECWLPSAPSNLQETDWILMLIRFGEILMEMYISLMFVNIFWILIGDILIKIDFQWCLWIYILDIFIVVKTLPVNPG